jgi:hypothetical protein
VSRSGSTSKSSEANDRFLGDITKSWQGHEGLKWVEPRRSAARAGRSGIGAELPTQVQGNYAGSCPTADLDLRQRRRCDDLNRETAPSTAAALAVAAY